MTQETINAYKELRKVTSINGIKRLVNIEERMMERGNELEAERVRSEIAAVKDRLEHLKEEKEFMEALCHS